MLTKNAARYHWVKKEIPIFKRLHSIEKIERWHFWFVGRQTIVRRLMQKYLDYPHQTILDLGCGTGLNVELLTNQG